MRKRASTQSRKGLNMAFSVLVAVTLAVTGLGLAAGCGNAANAQTAETQAGDCPTDAAVAYETVFESDESRGCAETTFTYFADETLYVQADGVPADATAMMRILPQDVGEYVSAHVETLVFSEGVTSIPANGYDGDSLNDFDASTCTLAKVVFPSTLETIGNDAFQGQRALAEVDLSGARSLKSIGEEAFLDCPLSERIVLPGGVEWVGKWAFYGCSNLRTLVMPDACKYEPEDVVDARYIESFTYANGNAAPFKVTGAGSTVSLGTYEAAGSGAVMAKSASKTASKKQKLKKLKVKRAGKRRLKVTVKSIKGIAKYKVRYRVKGKKKWKVKTMHAGKGKKRYVAKLRKLKSGKRYVVRVKAYRGGKLAALSKKAVSPKVK